MPSIRVGFGSDYVVKNQTVGIGTDNPRATLDVVGTLKGDISVSGVNTLSLYAGFIPEIQTIGENLTLTGEFNSPSEDIVVGAGVTFEVSVGSTFSAGSLESISVQSHFSFPDGGTLERPADPVEGMVRFNDDLNTLEFWNGFEWRQFTVTGASGRGVFAGGAVGSPSADSSLIEYINISSTGNAINFGNLTSARRFTTGCASEIRGIIHGGTSNTAIDYITIASEGNGISFGTANNRAGSASASSSTRGLFAGGYQPALPVNNIEYIQISTLGNSVDFGDLFTGRYLASGCSSSTRAIFGGGQGPSSVFRSIIDTVTISSLGNAVQFGNLTQSKSQSASVSNSTRGIFAAGDIFISPGVTPINTIDYVTLSSFGNASYFGDLTVPTFQFNGGSSTQIRGVFGGGYTSPGVNINVMSYVTIATTGNAIDFGDLSQQRRALTGFSDSHGGLGGF